MATAVVTIETFNGTEFDRQSDLDEPNKILTSGYTEPVPSIEQTTFTGYFPVNNLLNLALSPVVLSHEEAQELDDFIRNPRAFPTMPIQELPRGDRSRLRQSSL